MRTTLKHFFLCTARCCTKRSFATRHVSSSISQWNVKNLLCRQKWVGVPIWNLNMHIQSAYSKVQFFFKNRQQAWIASYLINQDNVPCAPWKFRHSPDDDARTAWQQHTIQCSSNMLSSTRVGCITQRLHQLEYLWWNISFQAGLRLKPSSLVVPTQSSTGSWTRNRRLRGR